MGKGRIEWAEKPWCVARSGKLADATIFMSSATDPYQGVERRLGLTRRALEAFVRHPPHRLVVQRAPR